MNIAIVDDEQKIADRLREFLTTYAAEKKMEIRTDWFPNPVQFLTQYTERYDLVLLDIDMPDMNGIDTAKKLREMDDTVSLIFVTNMRQYAVDGYGVDADDFIVKPVAYYDLALKLDRIRKKDLRGEHDVISVKSEDAVKVIDVRTIRYVEVIRHRLVFHTVEEEIGARGTLKKLEPILIKNHFVRCNNYCLVNLRYVTGIVGFDLHVSHGKNSDEIDTLDISHPRKRQFLLELNRYLGINF